MALPIPTRAAFRKHIRDNAAWIARAPGRVNLIGEHVDYQQGLVLPVALNRTVRIFARAADTPHVRIGSDQQDGLPAAFPLDALQPQTGANAWTNYVNGVIAQYQARGASVPGLDLWIESDLPAGAGLSSSAALETATALIVEAATGLSLDTLERARLCRRAEREYAGVPCGIMDQIAVGCGQAGHALLIDCRTQETTPIPLPRDLAIVVIDTHAEHRLRDGEYALRTRDCAEAANILGVPTLRETTPEAVEAAADRLGEQLLKRARHVTREIERVPRFARALASGDEAGMRALLFAGHASLRDDFDVSCPELDFLVERASACSLEDGLIGARMTGGGFGGCTVNLVRAHAARGIAASLAADYTRRTGTATEPLIVDTAAGASLQSR